jgi:2-keto-3-deoxy-L-rhamnonate aldolase RhmA
LVVANRVRQLYESGKPAFGTYVVLPTPASVEIAALAGFDFVRIDAYHIGFNPETLQAMVSAAYAANMTPWARCRNDPFTIMNVLDMGVQMLTIPNTPSAEAARAAVDSAFYPPRGKREMSRPLMFRGHSAPDYLEWVEKNVVVSCQIEGREGLDNYKEIVKVEGLGCIQTGRGDISLALGLPGQEFHPKVLEAEERIVTAALEAGKQVSLVHPLTDDGIARSLRWIERGVRILTMDADYRVLQRGWSEGMTRLRPTPSA